jgi:CheY-like chemotaxis protein
MAHVLVVDDDADCGATLCKLLIADGHEATSTPCGREALAAILARTPDLIITDLVMEGADGTELVRVLRSYLRLQHLPVIVYTGLSDERMLQPARDAGITAVAMKGTTTPSDLLRMVGDVLRAHAKD